MLISEKQQEANRRNAQHSTGPKTSEGKAAVRLNALKYGLRARSLLISGENPEDYMQLWADLEAEWQPQTRTERLHLEQMSTSQWLLARIARGESLIYESPLPLEKQFVLLRQAAALRAAHERSFASAMRELKQLQKERRAQAKPTVQAKPAPAPHPGYRMPAGTGTQPVSCAPVTSDTR